MSTLDTVMSFFQTQLGLTRDQAAGVAGNFAVESGLDPAAYNPREGAIGLAQWENGRRANLQAYAAATGGSESNLITQLNFAKQELQGPESAALAKLKGTTDAGSAAAVFDQYYERSSGAARQTRIAKAKAIASAPTSFLGGVGAGLGTVLGGVFGAGNSAGGEAVGQSVGQAASDALPDWGGTAMKLAAVGVAGALVVVGITHTVSS